MTFKQKKELIIETFKALDPSGYNAKKWEAKIKGMKEAEFTKLMKDPKFMFRLENVSFENEMDYGKACRYAKRKGIVIAEKVELRHIRKGVVSSNVVTLVPLTVQMLQQKIEKENASASDTTKRNSMNQVVKEDKAAQISDLEVNALVSNGRTETIKELMSPRAGNSAAKSALYNELKNEGRGTMPEAEINDPKNKTEVNILKNNYLGMGLVLDTE